MVALFAAPTLGQATTAASDTSAAASGVDLAHPWECTFTAACTASQGRRLLSGGAESCVGRPPQCQSPTGGHIAMAIIFPMAAAIVCSIITMLCLSCHNRSWRRGALTAEIEALKQQKEVPGANVAALNQLVAQVESALVDLPAIERAANRKAQAEHNRSRHKFDDPLSRWLNGDWGVQSATAEEVALLSRHPPNVYQRVMTPSGALLGDPKSGRMCGVGFGIIWGVAAITALVACLVIHARAPHFTCQLVTSAIGSNATSSGLYVPCAKVSN